MYYHLTGDSSEEDCLLIKEQLISVLASVVMNLYLYDDKFCYK